MPNILRLYLLLTFLGLAACSEEPISQLSDEDVFSTYYLGESTTRSDQGEEATDNLLLVRNVLVSQNRIEVLYYHWVDLDYIGQNHLYLTALPNRPDLAVEGKFFREELMGVGSVEGDPFGDWSQLIFRGELTHDSDIKIVGNTTLSANGKLINNVNIYYKEDELPIVTISDLLEEKSMADPDFADLYARVTGN